MQQRDNEYVTGNVFFWVMLILVGLGALMLLAVWKFDYGKMTKNGVYTFNAAYSHMEKDEQSGENVYYIAYRTEKNDDYGYDEKVSESEYDSFNDGGDTQSVKKSIWTTADGKRVLYRAENAKEKDVMNLAQRYNTQIRIGGVAVMGVGAVLYVVSIVARRRKAL